MEPQDKKDAHGPDAADDTRAANAAENPAQAETEDALRSIKSLGEDLRG
ncbi:hypothetical protein N1028_13365 [Herbiconiux sp. CPCC 203407]|uniref:Uncharacterized protein n=1 Tax=Herbiconiux oxytropis TaxID=2970915 RepID=A0AA41XHV6_9MICO|nr:hypothetical protein [Herbiconiux oxytropis]MCS5723048.1 hypothetical protein [Herbiconiux oxytropis]MCS5726883.1 hypothetical protein [Herbiconiux oxytropis]